MQLSMLFLVAVWPLVCGTNMGSLIAKVAVAPVAMLCLVFVMRINIHPYGYGLSFKPEMGYCLMPRKKNNAIRVGGNKHNTLYVSSLVDKWINRLCLYSRYVAAFVLCGEICL